MKSSKKEKTSRLSNKELALFTRRFATLARSGVKVIRVTEVCALDCAHKGLAAALTAIVASLREGSNFATAMAKYPEFFGGTVWEMFNAGEIGGTLDDCVERLADMYEKACALA